jgi:hypothetical protein
VALDYLIYYGFPIILMAVWFWYMRRQSTLMTAYRQGHELQQSLRLQTESNQLMRELIEALRQQR